jgi:ribosome-associated protein
MKIALLALLCPGVTPFVPAATRTTLLRTAPARQAVLVMAGSAAPRRSNGNKQTRRAKLFRDIEATPAPRLPDGPAEDDPASPLALAAARAGDDRKAQQITAIRVGHLTSATSFFVNMQGSSRAQIDAIVKNVEVELSERFGLEGSRQGKSSSGWVCLDFDSIVVNVFSPEERAFYGLEKFWSGGQKLDLSGVIPPQKAAAAEPVDDWAAGGGEEEDKDDWSLGADDWALGSADDWSLSGTSNRKEWAVSEEEASTSAEDEEDEWVLSDEDVRTRAEDDADDEDDWALSGADAGAGSEDEEDDEGGWALSGEGTGAGSEDEEDGEGGWALSGADTGAGKEDDEKDWALGGKAARTSDEEDEDDWVLREENSSTSSEDDWALSGDDTSTSAEDDADDWALSEEDTTELLGEESGDDEDLQEWMMSGDPPSVEDTPSTGASRDEAARNALAAKLRKMKLGSSSDGPAREIDLEAEIEVGEDDEDDWALGSDKLRVSVPSPHPFVFV